MHDTYCNCVVKQLAYRLYMIVQSISYQNSVIFVSLEHIRNILQIFLSVLYVL